MQFDIPTNIAVVVAIVASWGVIVLVSHLSYRRAFGSERLYKRYKRGLPYVTSEQALEVATERREHIEGFIREFGDRKSFPLEFLERPPEFTQIASRQFEDDGVTGAWHAARLRDELTDDRYLLAGRVIDAITCLQRTGQLSEKDSPSSIRLEPLESRFGQHKMFPWRVVIESAAHERICRLLEPLQRWFGVGVDFAKPMAIIPYGMCKGGGGASEGVVGGTLTINNDEFYVTCLHVLSDMCGSQYWPPTGYKSRQFTEMEPDAALLHTGGPCSLTREVRHSFDVICMKATDIKWAQKGDVKFKKSTDTSRRRAKIDIADVRSFFMSGRDYIGPHILLTPHFVKRFWVYWPLFPRRFSRQGESGTWIVDEDSHEWLGMIVGGYEPPLIGTVVLAGHHLLDATGASLNSGVWPTPKARG
ncbi:MAG: hypothetical protein JJT87_12585 [Halomonas sp.]|nr:hypothetical protein [Halomonas sp.]MCC5902747.1 hypothetical protein [Halomonas sp.]